MVYTAVLDFFVSMRIIGISTSHIVPVSPGFCVEMLAYAEF